MKIGFISCTKKKKGFSCPSEEIYSISPLFQKAYSYCKDHYDKVYILSAKYGLLKPDQVIDPYDQTLNSMKIWEKKKWSERVYQQFLDEMQFNAWDWSRIQLIAFHAGSEYRRFLVNYFKGKTLVSIPLQGFGRIVAAWKVTWLTKPFTKS